MRRVMLLILGCCFWWGSAPAQTTNSSNTNRFSTLIEVAGRVEVGGEGRTNWQAAPVGLALRPGDRVRTLERSRAAVQLSDRSVIRMNERTTLEILPPRSAAKRRFGLPGGSLFFFDREKPMDVEFDTPLAAGAIRGTEFLVEVDPSRSELHLAMLDGLVGLATAQGEIELQSGDTARVRPGQALERGKVVNVGTAIQWALYYPAVVNPDDLGLGVEEQRELREVLTHYREGDLIAALTSWPEELAPASSATRSLRAALELAVGRVQNSEELLKRDSLAAAAARALAELITTVRDGTAARPGQPRTSSEFLARSYSLQAVGDLRGARQAAREAVRLAPDFGLARVRLAELELAFGNRAVALASLNDGLARSPRFAPGHAVRGFALLEQGATTAALAAFDQARAWDAALSPAWVGRGLALLRDRRPAEAQLAFQAAEALEPQRGLFRAYAGKAAAARGDASQADRELELAKRLDPREPTSWLYSALQLWQENRLNEAIRDLERSADQNDQRAVFRSRLLLDQDRAVRSADLAALYQDAGMGEASRRLAARSVAEDYANFSSHLFLANSYQLQEARTAFDLRLESARQSELLLANLLAPPGAGNLSQLLSQQEHLRWFDPKPVGVSTLSEYASSGEWHQAGSVFGNWEGFSYALDADYSSRNGEQPNGASESRRVLLTMKQRIGRDDELYFQAGELEATAGDVANRFDPAQTTPGFHVKETQDPTLFVGWHHTWGPGNHTLLLFGRLADHLALRDPQADVLFLRQSNAAIVAVQSPPLGPPFTNDFTSRYTLYSVELQQILESDRQSLVFGGRWQSGAVDNHATLSRVAVGTVTDDLSSGTLQRGNAYAYYSLQLFDPLRLIGGVSYDHLEVPANSDIPPLTAGATSRDLVAPKAGVLFSPWSGGLLRASYSKSLGGLFFDNSVRLEPTQLGGFNQAFRSLIPESVTGLVPGTAFETESVGFDQSLAGGTYFGVEAEWLASDGRRTVGALTNFFFLPIPDSPASTRETLRYQERDLSVYAAQLLGNFWSVSARYRLSDAKLTTRFPELPRGAAGLNQLESDQKGLLQQVSLAANFNHSSGLFAQWESTWYHQNNSGYTPALSSADFWQHQVSLGYRFAQRRAELRVGVLNLWDTDYRLNPLNLHSDLARGRTLVTSLRLNF